MDKVIFVSGIGTGVGKSYATGWLACRLRDNGCNVITQKLIQTGNDEFSEDIDVHRQLMGMPYTEEDFNHTTAPIIFSYPASPHLAAEIDGKEIDLTIADKSTATLLEKYDTVLLEGAGGLMVPIKDFYLTIDFIAERKYPVALITNGILGSINHTILSIEALQNREIPIKYIIYNQHFDEDDVICADTIKYIQRYVAQYVPEAEFLIMPSLKSDK